MNGKKPDIFEFVDFRAYLKAYLDYVRNTNKAFSFQYLIDKYGLKTRSHWLDIIAGRRLTPQFIPAYITICGLSPSEADYFQALVAYGQAKSAEGKEHAFQELVRLSPSLKPVEIEGEAYRYFEHWYHPAMVSLLDVLKTEHDHRVIAQSLKPPISAIRARRTIALLTEMGFVSWNEDAGEWTIHKKFFRCTDSAFAAALKRFHRQLFDLAKTAYETDFDHQNFSSLTLSVGPQTRQEISSIIEETRRRILDLARQDTAPDRVVQVNLQVHDVSTRHRHRTRGRQA